jgi:hypothetical protein
MDIQIEVVGKQNKWVVNQSPIRIGSSPKCEVSLPRKQFPAVSSSHGELEIVNGTLRVGPRDPGAGDLFLNEDAAEDGMVILSGDVLRVGANGPELLVVFEEQAATRATYEPTKVIQAADVLTYQPTKVIGAPVPVAGAQARNVPAEPRPVRNPLPAPSPTRVEIPPVAVQHLRPLEDSIGTSDARDRWQEPRKASPGIPPKASPVSNVAAVAMPSDSGLDAKLRIMMGLQGASFGIILVLVILIFQLRSDLIKNREEIRAMRAQEQGVMGQLTPALDSRLTAFGQRMDMLDGKMKAGEEQMERGLDEKMKSAQDQLFVNLDAKMKSTEDHMVNRMNTELPPLLDKYINTKLLEMKH